MSFAQGECLGGGCSGGNNYPTGTLSSTTSSWATASFAIYAGEYAYYSVTSGETYEWSLLASDGGDASYNSQLTLMSQDGVTTYCYSDDVGATDDAKISWTATFTGTVRVLVSLFNCSTNSSFTTLVWRCSSCGAGSAPANDDCSGATALTVNGATCVSATNGDVSGATNSLITDCTGTGDDDVWYKFVATASANHVITVSGSASFDAVIELRSGACNGANMSCVDETFSGDDEVLNASGLTIGNTYYVRVYDWFTGAPATTTFTICVTTPDFCTAGYTYGTTSGDFIDGVELGSISNTATGTNSGPSYNDYTAQSTNLTAGFNYTVTITNGDYGGETMAAWIDYDQDNLLEVGEKLGESAGVNANTATTINFTVPSGATTGNTVMRVRAVWSDVGIDACSTYGWGETEDYTINITAACTTPATPVSLSTSGISTTGATLNWAAGTPAGSATVSYYWAIGPSGVTYESGYIDRGTTTSLSAVTAALSPGVTYYWTVKAVTSCNSTESAYAGEISFVSDCTTPASPTGLTTTGITVNGSTFTWSPGAPAGSPTVTYYWAVGTASGVTYEAGYTDRGTTTSTLAITFALSSNTTYYWTVKAVTSCDASASAYPSSSSFLTANVPTPLLIWDGSVSNEWTTAANWDLNQVPLVTDNVIIPDVSAASNRYPITQWDLSINSSAATRKCKSLTIQAGASVTLTGGASTVTVAGNVDIAGTFNHECGSNSNKFNVNSGGVVSVKSGGVLNVGSSSFAGTPGGTVNQYNDILVNGGDLFIEPGGKTFVMDNLVIKGSGAMYMEGGELWVKYYGNGSAADYGLDLWGASTMEITNGDIYLCGQASGLGMADWNATASVSITGGTFHALNEQSVGATNNAGYLNFGGHTINNLTVDRSGAASYISANSIDMTGDLTLTAGTFDANSLDMTIAGNVTNNGGTFTAGTGGVTLTGASKTIGGTTASQMAFNGLTVLSGASYTLNPSAVTNFDVNGSFEVQSGATLTIASGKFLDIYSSTAGGETVTVNGTITSSANYNNVQELDFNKSVNFAGTGTLNADIRIYDDILTIVNDFTLNGDLEMNDGGTVGSQGTLAFSASETLTLGGDLNNEYGLTAGTGTILFTGAGKDIFGDSNDNFNNVTFITGSSYTLTPTATNNDMSVDGNFIMQTGSSLDIAAGKLLDIYSSGAETVDFDGTITAVDVYDGTRDIDLNNTVTFSGDGSMNADFRIYAGTATLDSDFDLDGDFAIRAGAAFAMSGATANNYNVSGSWLNDGTFNSGIGTVLFDGSVATRIIDANGLAEDFNDVKITRGSGTIKLDNTYMKVSGSLNVISGTISAGDASQAYKLRVMGPTTVYDGASINTGMPSVGEASGGGTVTDFMGDLTVHGQITTDRPLISGYADIFIYPSKIKGDGDVDEVKCDIQIFESAPTEQTGDLYVSGDLIVQTLNTWTTANPNSVLTIGGNLYIYHNFNHNGTVNLYGNFREHTPVNWNADVVNIAQSTFNMYNSKFINFNPSSGFGNLNIKSGTRSINESGGQTPYTALDIVGNLTIDNGATLDAGTGGKDINLESDWTNNNTTDGFTEGTNKVSFAGSDEQLITGAGSTTFYGLEANNTSSTGVRLGKSAIVSGALTLTDGYIYTSSSKLLTLNDNATATSGSAGSFVDGPLKKIGDETFTYPVGKDATWARMKLQDVSGSAATDAFSVEYFDNEYGTNNYNNVVAPLIHGSAVEYWDITELAGTPTKKVGIYSENKTTSGINEFNDVDLRVAHWNGSNWESAHTTDANDDNSGTGSAGWIMSDNCTSFSPYTFATKSNTNLLPIELLTFNAIANKDKVDITWVTSAEVNNDYFTVERSIDLKNIEEVGRLVGAGNSATTLTYYMADENPYTGVSYYRLKQTDFDGSIEYYNWVAVEINQISENTINVTEKPDLIDILNVYPNPTRDMINVIFNCDRNQKVSYTLYDLTGRSIFTDSYSATEGINTVQFDMSELKNGYYILLLNNNNTSSQTKIIKQ